MPTAQIMREFSWVKPEKMVGKIKGLRQKRNAWGGHAGVKICLQEIGFC